MPDRTRIVCLHEGQRGRSIDPVFINKLLRSLDPAWLRPWPGNNAIRLVPCGGRSDLVAHMPSELRNCVDAGGLTTLMVWADLDHDMPDGEALKEEFWRRASQEGISRSHFDQAVFVFAKDRLENWVEYLLNGSTNEQVEGPRVENSAAARAARELANRCQGGVTPGPAMPPSLEWSCRNWRRLAQRMKE